MNVVCPAQANKIQKSYGFLREAHIHMLVNMMSKPVVVMQMTHDHLCCLKYDPGFEAQKDVRRAPFKEMFTAPDRPYLMFLKDNHFSAVVPRLTHNDQNASTTTPKRRKPHVPGDSDDSPMFVNS